MNVLEKILEEIKNNAVLEGLHWDCIRIAKVEEIIRNHMNDGEDIKVPTKRLIDANALDEEVKNFFLTITGDLKQSTVVRECKKSFRRMIDEQPTLCVNDNDGWIPCNERLPERTAGETIQGAVFSVTKVRGNRRWTSVERYDFESMTWGGKDKVVAWQPLLETYKEKR